MTALARHTVVVTPRSIEFSAPDGAPLMAAAQEAGLVWPTSCGGKGECTICFVIITAGTGNLGQSGEREQRMLELLRKRYPDLGPDQLRLACQATVHGPVTVRKPGVRRAARRDHDG